MSYFQGYELGYGVGYQAGFAGRPVELVEREVIESLRRITFPEKFLTTFITGWRDGYQKASKNGTADNSVRCFTETLYADEAPL